MKLVRLERHFTKEEILEAYFSLAPYGGNIEGVEAARKHGFRKTNKLTMSEAALLVALPQSLKSEGLIYFQIMHSKQKRLILEKTKKRLENR